MTLDDHRAAAREMAIVHRGVAEFQNTIPRVFEEARQAGRSRRDLQRRMRTNLKRVHRSLEKIQAGMREAQTRTRPGDAHDSCWQEIATVEPTATIQRVTGVLPLDQHIAAARAFGPSHPAIHRFLDIINMRRYLPVRIMDYAIRINHLIQILRCEMEDFQFYTVSGRGIPWVNCWLGSSNHFDGVEAGNPGEGTSASA